MKSYLLAATSFLALPVVAAPAFAQKPAAAAEANNTGLEEIVVTAQRKSQTLLSVPLSISAQSGQTLQNRGVRDIVALQFTEPGFLPSDNVGYTQLFVRGVGNSVFGYADPTVPVYIDQVPRLYPTLIATLFDVERIELLKGAQGGLYGRNATGGVLNIITRQPNLETPEFSGRISYGTKKTFSGAGFISVPLVKDKVAISLSGQRDSHGPYVREVKPRNIYTAANFPGGSYLGTADQTAAFLNTGIQDQKGSNNKNFFAVDGKLLLKPTDDVKITLAADYAQKHDNGGDGTFNRTPAYEQIVLKSLFAAFGIPNATFQPGFVQGIDGKFTHVQGVQAFNHNWDGGVSGTVEWSLPGFDLTSITAYRKQKNTNLVDINNLNVPVINTISTFKKHFFYQELRAVSNGAGPFHWLGGGTYLQNHIYSDVRSPILMPLFPSTSTIAVDEVKNYTIYGQVGYDFTSALNLTVSGRYIHEKHTSVFLTSANQTVALKEKKFIPSATLSYKLEGGGNIYVRWARGFKAGGISTVVPPSFFPTRQGLTFDPEVVDTYEGGVRASLFDRKVQITTAVFYNDYKNLQVTSRGTAAFPQLIFAVVNAPKARTYGAEASVTWRATRGLTLGANAGYLHARYIKYQITSAVLQVDNFDHTQMINSPKFQGAIFADLDQPINDSYRAVGSLIVSHVSKVLFQGAGSLKAAGLFDATGHPYTLVNLRLGVRTADDRYGVSVYADNLFNEGYLVGGNISGTSGVTGAWGNPRIVGVEFSVKY